MIRFHELDNTTDVADDQTAYEQFRYDFICDVGVPHMVSGQKF